MSQSQYQASNVPALDELATMHQLGARIDSYSYQKGGGIFTIVVFLFIIIGVILIGLPFAFLLVFASFLPTSPGESISPVAIAVVTIFGVLLVVGFLGVIGYGVMRIVTSWRGFGSTIYLYRGGFIYAKGNKVEALRWDQVSNVRESASGGTRFRAMHTYTIRLVDGRKFRFNDLYENIQSLGSHLMREGLQQSGL
jgi:hypothetical protein